MRTSIVAGGLACIATVVATALARRSLLHYDARRRGDARRRDDALEDDPDEAARVAGEGAAIEAAPA